MSSSEEEDGFYDYELNIIEEHVFKIEYPFREGHTLQWIMRVDQKYKRITYFTSIDGEENEEDFKKIIKSSSGRIKVVFAFN